jgi:hypothetical protein
MTMAESSAYLWLFTNMIQIFLGTLLASFIIYGFIWLISRYRRFVEKYIVNGEDVAIILDLAIKIVGNVIGHVGLIILVFLFLVMVCVLMIAMVVATCILFVVLMLSLLLTKPLLIFESIAISLFDTIVGKDK